MLHRASFNAINPERVAFVLSEIFGAVAIKAPSPPFPVGSWLVCRGDAQGSVIEILPWGIVLDPLQPNGVGHDEEMRGRSGFHLLMTSGLSAPEILTLSRRAGWRTVIADARGYKVIKIWVENVFLIEAMSPDMAEAYFAMFGEWGIELLDARMRFIEEAMTTCARLLDENTIGTAVE